MDADKLAALVEQQSRSPFGALGKTLDAKEQKAESEGRQRGEELIASMGAFGAELMEIADILVERAALIGHGLLEDVMDDNTLAAVEEAVENMPDHIANGIATHMGGKSREDLNAIAAELCRAATDGGDAQESDASLVGGFLLAASEVIDSDDDDEEEDENAPEDDGEDDDDFDEEDDDQ